MNDDITVIQDRINRVVTALLVERSGESNSVRWGGPTIADLVADDELWMMDLLRDTVNESEDAHRDLIRRGAAFTVANVSDDADWRRNEVRLRFLPAGEL